MAAISNNSLRMAILDSSTNSTVRLFMLVVNCSQY